MITKDMSTWNEPPPMETTNQRITAMMPNKATYDAKTLSLEKRSDSLDYTSWRCCSDIANSNIEMQTEAIHSAKTLDREMDTLLRELISLDYASVRGCPDSDSLSSRRTLFGDVNMNVNIVVGPAGTGKSALFRRLIAKYDAKTLDRERDTFLEVEMKDSNAIMAILSPNKRSFSLDYASVRSCSDSGKPKLETIMKAIYAAKALDLERDTFLEVEMKESNVIMAILSANKRSFSQDYASVRSCSDSDSLSSRRTLLGEEEDVLVYVNDFEETGKPKFETIMKAICAAKTLDRERDTFLEVEMKDSNAIMAILLQNKRSFSQDYASVRSFSDSGSLSSRITLFGEDVTFYVNDFEETANEGDKISFERTMQQRSTKEIGNTSHGVCDKCGLRQASEYCHTNEYLSIRSDQLGSLSSQTSTNGEETLVYENALEEIANEGDGEMSLERTLQQNATSLKQVYESTNEIGNTGLEMCDNCGLRQSDDCLTNEYLSVRGGHDSESSQIIDCRSEQSIERGIQDGETNEEICCCNEEEKDKQYKWITEMVTGWLHSIRIEDFNTIEDNETLHKHFNSEDFYPQNNNGCCRDRMPVNCRAETCLYKRRKNSAFCCQKCADENDIDINNNAYSILKDGQSSYVNKKLGFSDINEDGKGNFQTKPLSCIKSKTVLCTQTPHSHVKCNEISKDNTDDYRSQIIPAPPNVPDPTHRDVLVVV